MKKIRKKPICKKCCTPMKGHKRGTCRKKNERKVIPISQATPSDTNESEEWKPLANKLLWDYYQNWQKNSTFVPFPTRMGMTGAQLGDIMENYAKYAKYYQ